MSETNLHFDVKLVGCQQMWIKCVFN